MQNKYPFELSALKSSNVPMATVLRGDVVKIADSDLDWLQSFYNENFDGNPIKLFSERFAVSVLNDIKDAPNKNEYFLFFVRAIDGGKFIQVDVYQKSVGNMVLWTEVLDNSKPMSVIDGHFHMESYSIHHDGGLLPHSSDMASSITMYISDVVHYVIFYMQENINNPEYVNKTVTTTTQTIGSKKNKKAKKKLTRSTMYVPRRIVTNVDTATTGAAQIADISAVQSPSNVVQAAGNDTGTNTSSTGQPAVNKGLTTAHERTYHLEEWPTRGYKRTITHNDGTKEVINVPKSTHKRNPMLMKKSNGKEGVDIKLRPKKP